MAKKVVVNPVTRISGFMEIEAYIENGSVIDAKTKGLLFRGFEKMLVGRSPFDAVYFTQRICGICSTAHSIASTLALESALGINPAEQGRYLRDIIHGSEFLQNHIRQFYQYTIPDFVKLPQDYSLFTADHNDFRLPKEKNDIIARHYFESFDLSRQAHEMLAVLGGKAPHNHGVFIGGITTKATIDKIIKIKSILNRIRQFIIEKMIPDVYIIADYYSEYFFNGKGHGNLLSYGCFANYMDLGTLYTDPLIFQSGYIQPFDPAGISEEIDYSWYSASSEPDMNKSQAYSWIKAARYKNAPFETGPLARQWLNGRYRRGISTMDRIIARVLEARDITIIIETLLNNLIPNLSAQMEYEIPQTAEGAGLVDTTRGALGHWLTINNRVIASYQIITPSVWNLSTRGDALKGTAEQALIGTSIQNADNPVELGRIIRSFDPCVSCATHVFSQGIKTQIIEVVP